MIVMDAPGGPFWGFCDSCGAPFLDGWRAGGYVVLSRVLAGQQWQQHPYLEVYCPTHAL